MGSRLKRIIRGVTGVALGLVLLTGLVVPGRAVAEPDTGASDLDRLVPNTGERSWSQRPNDQESGPVAVLVYIDMLPLGVVGRTQSAQERLDYAAQIRAAQDQLLPRITALGGQVLGRFTHASTGLAVTIDSSRVEALRGLGGVLAVHQVTNYQLALSDSVPWIGATEVQQRLGLSGRDVDIAVIDTGVDYTHRKLGGPGTREAYNAAYCGDPRVDPRDPTTGVCQPAYDRPATAYFPNAKVKGGYDWVGELWPNRDRRCGLDANGTPQVCIVPDTNPIDINGHGTHVADIAAGLDSSAQDSVNDSGVAPGANIWAFKACSATAGACDGLALLLALDDAMDLDNNTATYDPADVINLSLGAIYGQPEDDLTLFADIASYYGSLVVAAAGNGGDKPYIISSPSTASAALSVAQSTMPNERLFAINAGSVSAAATLQLWSSPFRTQLSGPLQYGDGAGGNLNGCSAYNSPQTGKVLLVDRGGCTVSAKAAAATAAGAAFVIIANNQFSNTPPTFAFGGGAVAIPALVVTQNDGAALKVALGQNRNLRADSGPAALILLRADIVATSSRGPRIADGAIKPDLAAPGASISAVAGSGSGKAAFGGTSGAAPMVAGGAALLIEALEQRGLLNSAPGLDAANGTASLAPLVKALLMNTANPATYIGGSAADGGRDFLAPITLQGAGRLDLRAAVESHTIAWDVTDLDRYLMDKQSGQPVDPACQVRPVLDVLFYYFLGMLPRCASDSSFGNDFFTAWNQQTGSISFKYNDISGYATQRRKILILNLSATEQTYQLSSLFRYQDDADKGATLSVTPATITIPPGQPGAVVDVTLELRAANLRDWSFDGGQYGASGTNIYCADPTYDSIPIVGEPTGPGCPTLQMYEIDGVLTIDGGPGNTVRLPWQVLPSKAANTYVSSVLLEEQTIRLRNPARFKAGDVDVFALIDVSPNDCDVVDANGRCLITDYQPGIIPGLNASPVDLHEVGIRSYVVPGLNAYLGLPEAPYGAIPDEVIEFGLSVYDAPFRASRNFPVMFEVLIDADRDGRVDYIAFNADLSRDGSDGRNAVFVCESRRTGDAARCDTGDPVRPYFYTLTDFNSQNWVMSVPAAALGLASTQPFDFAVRASDIYFTGLVTDCAPVDCQGFFTYQTGLPKYNAFEFAFQIPPQGSYTINYERSERGLAASPSQIGLLFFHRDGEIGRESSSIRLDP